MVHPWEEKNFLEMERASGKTDNSKKNKIKNAKEFLCQESDRSFFFLTTKSKIHIQ